MASEALKPSRYSVRAIDRVLDLLDALRRAGPGGASLAVLTRTVGLPKSSVYRHLCTLEERGYVERDEETSNYRMGLALFFVLDEQLQLLRRSARPYLQQLRQRFDETINLGILDGGRVAYLDIVESSHALRMASRLGDRDPIHSTALGKAIAASLTEPEVLRILRIEGMPQQSERTITDPGDFLAELDVVREQGYALDNGESDAGGRCVGVAADEGPVRYALSLSAPTMRFSLEQVEEIAGGLKSAINALMQELSTHRMGGVDAAGSR